MTGRAIHTRAPEDLVVSAVDAAKLNRPAYEGNRNWRIGFAREACRQLLIQLEDEGWLRKEPHDGRD